MLLDREPRDGFTRLGNSAYDLLRPSRLDTDHDAGRNIGVASGADHRSKVQLEILTEL